MFHGPSFSPMSEKEIRVCVLYELGTKKKQGEKQRKNHNHELRKYIFYKMFTKTMQQKIWEEQTNEFA